MASQSDCTRIPNVVVVTYSMRSRSPRRSRNNRLTGGRRQTESLLTSSFANPNPTELLAHACGLPPSSAPPKNSLGVPLNGGGTTTAAGAVASAMRRRRGRGGGDGGVRPGSSGRCAGSLRRTTRTTSIRTSRSTPRRHRRASHRTSHMRSSSPAPRTVLSRKRLIISGTESPPGRAIRPRCARPPDRTTR